MTAPDSVPLHALAEDNLAAASPDLLRAMVKTFADALMSAVLRRLEQPPSPATVDLDGLPRIHRRAAALLDEVRS